MVPRSFSLPARLICFALLLLTSCNAFDKKLKNPDVNYRLVAANEYFDKKEWSKAQELYRSLLPVVKNTRNYEPVYWRYAYTYWYQKDYLNSSYHFKNFSDFFPTSKDAEEAEFLFAVSMAKQSPKSSLMQANTERAIDALREYAVNHPQSPRLPEVNMYLDEAAMKLEEKESTAAKLYYDIGQYKAAAIAYREVMNEYPQSANSDLYQYMILKSLYFYAQNSLAEKQEDRYANALAAYQELRTTYPKSKLLSDAARYQELAEAGLQKIRKNKS